MGRRAIAYATVAIFAVYIGLALVGPHDNLLATGFVVVAMPRVGMLGWSLVGATLSVSASWAVPLLIWQAVIFVTRPSGAIAVIGFLAAGIWMAAFSCWTPVVPWWYGHVLRRPVPRVTEEG